MPSAISLTRRLFSPYPSILTLLVFFLAAMPALARSTDGQEAARKLSDSNIERHQLQGEELEIYRRASELYNRGIDYVNKKRKELGEEGFQEAIADGLMIYPDAELEGEIELSLLNGDIFSRVKLEDYPGLSINFIDQSTDTTTDHARKYVARQHEKGSDVLVFTTYHETVQDIKLDKKPPFFSFRKLRDFWDSFRAKPTAGDVVYLGIINGAVIQGALVAWISTLKSEEPLTYIDALQRPETLFTAVFGLTIGVFIKAYKNFTYQGSKLRRVMSSMTVSAAFAYIYATLVIGAEELWPNVFEASQTELLTAGTAHFFLLLNQIVNNFGKDDYFMVTRSAEKLRELRGDIKIPFFPDLGIINALHQSIYSLISFPLKMLDMAGVKRESFIASVIGFRALNVRYFDFRYRCAVARYRDNPTDENKLKMKRLKKWRQEAIAKGNLDDILKAPYRWVKSWQKKAEYRRTHTIHRCTDAFQRFTVADITAETTSAL